MEWDKQRPIRWRRIVGFLLLLGVFGEAGSQLAVFFWAKERYRTFALYVWSPYGLIRNNPRVTSPAFRINANGFRALRDYTRTKPKNTLRVMMFGGSVLYSGLGGVPLDGVERVDSGSTMAQYLEARLRRDPRMAGMNIEVINAAVNFNRIVEVSSAYLAEYAFWEPDVVIVCGSFNNFGRMAKPGDVIGRKLSLQADHPWKLEFERLVNQRSFASMMENSILTLEEHLASVGLLKKLISKSVDEALIRTERLSALMKRPLGEPPLTAASWEEYDGYVREYLGYADAMIAAARIHQQEIAFFWEYLLPHLGGIKPMSEEEKILYVRNGGGTELSRLAREFDVYSRDKVAEFVRRRGVLLLDPLERLKTHSETVFIDYGHYTKAGNEFMAEFIYEMMKAVFHERVRRLRMVA